MDLDPGCTGGSGRATAHQGAGSSVIYPYEGVTPELGADVVVAPGAVVIGRVTIGARSSIWYGSVLRGDVGAIYIGEDTNIQDLSMVHVTTGLQDTHIGNRVTVGHRAILHGCTVEDEVLIGMGAIVLDGATIGEGSLVGANALVTAGSKIPPNSLVLGSPGKVVKQLDAQARQSFIASAAHYVDNAAKHRVLEPV